MKPKVKLIIISLTIAFIFAEAKSPPKFINFSDKEILIQVKSESRSFVLTCEAEGEPTPDYYWLKNGEFYNWTTQNDRIIQIPRKGTLWIQRSEASDVGEYKCVAENIWGITISNPVSVRIAEIGPYKETVWAVEGAPFHLPCQIPDGYPKPIVAWVKENSDGAFVNIHDPRITHDPEGTLWFSNITQKDSSINSFYSCAATSPALLSNQYQVIIQKRVELKVVPRNSSLDENLIAPVKQYTSPEVAEGIANDPISLYCVFGGTPLPNIKWYKNGEPIQFNDNITLRETDKIVRIQQLSLTDEGNYTCQASNGFGDSKSHTTSLKIQAKPTFTKIPTSANKAIGETIEFNCEATGIPMPEIAWSFNGKPLSVAPFNPRRTVTKNSIIIEKLQINDTGNYGCYAINSIGYIFQDAFVNVLAEAPQIIESSAPNEEITEGSTMVLRCRATGWPNPRIIWVKNNAQVSGNRFSQSENGDLTIDKITFNDMGNYTCSAHNQIAYANTIINLQVRKRTLIPPGLGPSDTTVPAGKPATFKCSSTGDPSLETQFYWLRNGESIDFSTEPRFVQTNDNSLTILKTSQKDNGKYTCVAKTRVDEAKAEATLTVQNAV